MRARVVQPTLHGPGRPTQHLAHLSLIQFEVIAKGDDETLGIREHADRRYDCPLLVDSDCVFRHRLIVGELRRVSWQMKSKLEAAATKRLPRAIYNDSIEPGSKRPTHVVLVNLLEGPHEGVGDDILSRGAFF